MKRPYLRVLLIVAPLFLAGCDAVRLSQLSSEFRQALDDKGKEINADRLRVLPSESVRGQFRQIAEEASDSAEKISLTDKPRLRIGYRRLAVLAAWQAAPEEGDPVLSLQAKGKEDCGKGANYIRSPRDCLMIDAVGALASQDATWRRMETLRRQRVTAESTVAHLEGYRSGITAYMTYFSSLADTVILRRGTLSVDPKIWDALRDHMKRIYCNASFTVDFYAQIDESAERLPDGFEPWETHFEALEASARNGKIAEFFGEPPRPFDCAQHAGSFAQ